MTVFNTSRSPWSRRPAAMLAVLLVLWVRHPQPLRALDAGRSMFQYLRDEWTAAKGFPAGTVSSIAQTADGYLWIGGTKGLVRFDGLKFDLVPLPIESADSGPAVLSVAADAAGTLWARLRGPSLLHQNGGAFDDAFAAGGLRPSIITAMCRGIDGSMLTVSLAHGLVQHHGRRITTMLAPSAMPRAIVTAVAQTADSRIWLGTRDAGLFRVEDAAAVSSGVPLPDPKVNSLIAGPAGDVWVGTDRGVVHSVDGRTTAVQLRGRTETAALGMMRDRDGNIWVAAGSAGLFRVSGADVTALSDPEGQPRHAVTAVFEDREGNVWVGSSTGIERLRNGVFASLTSARQLPTDGVGALYADDADRTWAAGLNGGLFQLASTGRVRAVPEWPADDTIYSISGHGADLWMGTRRSGLAHLRIGARGVTREMFTTANGLASNSVYAVRRTDDGAVWAGTLNAGLTRLFQGTFTTYTSGNGLPSNSISAIEQDAAGRLWVGTAKGVGVLVNDHWQTLTSVNGLPSIEINCLLARPSGEVWAGTAAGLALLKDSGVVRMTLPRSLRAAILGVAEDHVGGLWVTTVERVLRVDARRVLDSTVVDADVREFDAVDGLASSEGVKRDRSATTDRSGRVWLAVAGGLSMADPRLLDKEPSRPLVAIDGVFADGVAIDRQALTLPSSTRRLVLTFVGLSLSAPERVRFRYRLDGFDSSWSAPSSDRQAAYTNLSSGAYTFHVMAAAGDGQWGSDGAQLSFRVTPMFWQTWWFRLSVLTTSALIVRAVYHIRLLQLARQLNARFEERLAERTRIAQELHDTLLQGFVSASMQLHVVADSMPSDTLASRSLSHVLQLMHRVIEEGRNAVRGLRSNAAADDLETAFGRVPVDMGLDEAVEYRVIVEGQSRTLHPLVRDEVFRIGREALANAIRHAGATRIEVELDYGQRELRMLVRDNGRGIDEEMMRRGRDGHWGLSGMRERSERIGAKLRLWGRTGAGTEVELVVPNHIAFSHNRTATEKVVARPDET